MGFLEIAFLHCPMGLVLVLSSLLLDGICRFSCKHTTNNLRFFLLDDGGFFDLLGADWSQNFQQDTQILVYKRWINRIDNKSLEFQILKLNFQS